MARSFSHRVFIRSGPMRLISSGIMIGSAAMGFIRMTAAQEQSTPAGEEQSASSNQLADIVVTAQKHTEKLREVPFSVAAMGRDELQRRNIGGLQDLMSGQVPSLRVLPFAGNPSILEVGVRGFVDPNGVNVTNENLVPVYIDDVYYGRQTAISLQPNFSPQWY